MVLSTMSVLKDNIELVSLNNSGCLEFQDMFLEYFVSQNTKYSMMSLGIASSSGSVETIYISIYLRIPRMSLVIPGSNGSGGILSVLGLSVGVQVIP